MTTRDWFEIDDPDDEFELTDAEREFVSGLNGYCRGWAPADVFGEVGRPDGWGALLASVALSDRAEPRLHLVDLGVHLVGDRVQGDRLHNQLFQLPDAPSAWALDATGPTDRLARLAADWFRTVLDKPIVLYVWLHKDYAYAARYAFADSGETICQSYARTVAPPGQAEELIAAGHVRGRDWVQTVGLPTPSLYLHIRGDLGKAGDMAGVPAGGKRGPLPRPWYE